MPRDHRRSRTAASVRRVRRPRLASLYTLHRLHGDADETVYASRSEATQSARSDPPAATPPHIHSDPSATARTAASRRIAFELPESSGEHPVSLLAPTTCIRVLPQANAAAFSPGRPVAYARNISRGREPINRMSTAFCLINHRHPILTTPTKPPALVRSPFPPAKEPHDDSVLEFTIQAA